MADLRQAFLTEIRRHFGTPYNFGGKGPHTFDCSGVLTYSARQVGLDLGDPNYTSADGLKGYCTRIDMADAKPGDLYLFHTTYGGGGVSYATHCGAALGDGRSMYDDHGSPWPGCGKTDITAPYWQAHLMGAWRPRGFGAVVEEDQLVIADLEQRINDAVNLLGVIQGDWVDAAASAVQGAKAEDDPAQREALLDAALAALATIKRGG